MTLFRTVYVSRMAITSTFSKSYTVEPPVSDQPKCQDLFRCQKSPGANLRCVYKYVPIGFEVGTDTRLIIVRFSLDCRNTKAVTLTNHKKRKQHDEPIRNGSKYMLLVPSAGKRV